MANSYAAGNLYWPAADEWRTFDWTDAWDAETQESRYEYWETTGEQQDTVYHSATGSALVFTSRGKLAAHQPHEDGFEGEVPEGPMMTGYWPLADFLPVGMEPEDVAWRMRHLSVCLVKVDEQYGVALTGGGMDLSWELAAGAIAAGFLPWSRLSLGSWEYGIATVGEPWAKRIRAARRHRLRSERKALSWELQRIGARWR